MDMTEKLSPARLESLVEAAILAPSSHNTQPWVFRVSDNRIALLADRTRALPANDPDDRELTISCGAVLFNIQVAAAHSGLGTTTRTLPDEEDDDLLAIVYLHEDGQQRPQDVALYPAIAKRRTYRKRFEEREVPASVLIELAGAVEQEQAWLKVMTDEHLRKQAAELVAEGAAAQWSNPSWRRELAAWMHSRRKGDGLSVPGLIAPLAKTVVRTFDMGNGIGAKDRQLAEQSPVLAVLGTPGDAPTDWLSAGQALQRLLLLATNLGLQASYINQPIQVACLRPKLQHACSDAGFPQLLLRIGFTAENMPATARRPLANVIE
jgi:nitroreductase